jgi:SAM-dependent methyltransferase
MSIEKRREYKDYDEYKAHQLEKTLTPKLRATWTRKFDKKSKVFVARFEHLKEKGILKDDQKALCLGARMGEEVAALQSMGVDAIGVDLAPAPPLVVEGDFNNLDFPEDSFDVVYSNALDHAWTAKAFFDNVSKVLKPGGYFIIDVFPGEANYGRCEVLVIFETNDVEDAICGELGFDPVLKTSKGLPGLQRRHKEVQCVFQKKEKSS